MLLYVNISKPLIIILEFFILKVIMGSLSEIVFLCSSVLELRSTCLCLSSAGIKGVRHHDVFSSFRKGQRTRRLKPVSATE